MCSPVDALETKLPKALDSWIAGVAQTSRETDASEGETLTATASLAMVLTTHITAKYRFPIRAQANFSIKASSVPAACSHKPVSGGYGVMKSGFPQSPGWVCVCTHAAGRRSCYVFGRAVNLTLFQAVDRYSTLCQVLASGGCVLIVHL
ncbi:uncharacterized [Tachysurus ichikawai]